MTDSPEARLSAAHLDDLAIIVLTTPPGHDAASTWPELSEDDRGRLRSRLKLISRHDWPSNMREDPAIRRGYTLRQCFRLMTALLLLDAHIPISMAIPIARSNELLFLRMITSRLTSADILDRDDQLAVIILSQFAEWLGQAEWNTAEPYRVRLLARSQCFDPWSNGADLQSSGQRLVIDVGGVAGTLWRWIEARRLLPTEALASFIAEINAASEAPAYELKVRRSTRR